MNKVFVFLYVLALSSATFAQKSQYGTGFALGTKEDLEIRLAWAKKDPCFVHGFSPMSLEYQELKKYRAIQAGPNGKPVICERQTSTKK